MIYGAVSLAALHEWNEEGKTVPELEKASRYPLIFFIFCGFIKQNISTEEGGSEEQQAVDTTNATGDDDMAKGENNSTLRHWSQPR